MSLAFRIEALPLMYLPLMGEGQPYDRFDNIWGGVIAKRVCDHLGWLRFQSAGQSSITAEPATPSAIS